MLLFTWYGKNKATHKKKKHTRKEEKGEEKKKGPSWK